MKAHLPRFAAGFAAATGVLATALVLLMLLMKVVQITSLPPD